MKLKLDDVDKNQLIIGMAMAIMVLLIVTGVQAYLFSLQEHNTSNLIKSSYTLLVNSINDFNCDDLSTWISESKTDMVQGKYAISLNELAVKNFEAEC